MEHPFKIIAKHLPQEFRIDRAVICVSSRKTKNGARKYVVNALEKCFWWWNDDEMDEACWGMASYGLDELEVGQLQEFEDGNLCLELQRPSKTTFILSAFWDGDPQ